MAPTPPRRMTRSQSRELEDSVPKNGLFAKSAVQNAGFPKAGSSRLSMVHEESPAVSRQTPVSRLGSSAVPESPSNPEGQSNISGTTVVPQDSSFEVGELDPVTLVEELPDLHNATKRLLDLFVSKAKDPRHILDEAKRINNPRNTISQRLKIAVRKFMGSMNFFSNQGFIDVANIKELIPSVTLDDESQAWSPSPILHRANCARLALNVLLATIGSQSSHQAIVRLQSQFPAPFMDKIVRGSQPKPAGASILEKETFELALEIRTQYFIIELERHQTEKNFDPGTILKGVFYDDLALEDDASAMDPGSLKGFRLSPTFEDENGRLPDQYQDDVIDRIGELEWQLDQDDALDVGSLKRAWWSRFIQRTARFIHSRSKEIVSDLQRQPKIDDVQDMVRSEIERRLEYSWEESPRESGNSVPGTDPRSSRALLPHDDRGIPRQSSVNATPSQSVHSPPPATGLQPSPQIIAEQTSPQRPVDQASATNLTIHSRARGPRKSRTERELLSGFDGIKRYQSRGPEQDLSHLESQHPNRPFGTQQASAIGTQAPPARTQTDEVPQSPVPNDYPGSDDWQFGVNEEAESTESPAMRRTHNGIFAPSSTTRMRRDNLLFVDSSPSAPTQTSPPKSTAEIRKDIFDRQPQRRTLIDPQPDARRVSPISESQSIERPRASVMPPLSSSKRSRPDSDDSDDAFDQDDRDIDLTARRARKPTQVSSKNKRPRLNHSVESDAAAQLRENLTASSQARPAQSAQPVLSPQQAHATASPSAEARRLLPFTSSQSRTQDPSQTSAQEPSQTRTQEPSRWRLHNIVGDEQSYGPVVEQRRGRNTWSQAETERLLMLMARYGTFWAEIWRQDSLAPESEGGPLLTNRTQVNLKDKARTIKTKCEREGLPIPPGFEGVGTKRN